jgi:hypothetical protein
MGYARTRGVSHIIAKGNHILGARLALLRKRDACSLSVSPFNPSTVYKFSLTSPIRTYAHQLLNTWQSKGIEDVVPKKFKFI